MIRVLAAVALALLVNAPANGRTLAELEGEGFLVERVLFVDGDFRGCDPLHPIHLTGGADFLCLTRSFTYMRRPAAFVLYHPVTDERVLSIGGVEYPGRLEGVARLPRRIDTIDATPEYQAPISVRLAPNEADQATSPLSLTPAIELPFPPGHDNGEPHQWCQGRCPGPRPRALALGTRN